MLEIRDDWLICVKNMSDLGFVNPNILRGLNKKTPMVY